MLTILNVDGTERFTLRLGQRPQPHQLEGVLESVSYVRADGLELDECWAILGRRGRGPKHTFDCNTTEEILLNWS